MINFVQLITHFLTIVLSCKGKGPGLRWPPKESEGDSWPPQPQTSHQWTKVLAVSGVLTFTVTSAHYSGRFTMLLTRLVTSASLTAPVVNRCHSLISRFLLSADHHTTTSASLGSPLYDPRPRRVGWNNYIFIEGPCAMTVVFQRVNCHRFL